MGIFVAVGITSAGSVGRGDVGCGGIGVSALCATGAGGGLFRRKSAPTIMAAPAHNTITATAMPPMTSHDGIENCVRAAGVSGATIGNGLPESGLPHASQKRAPGGTAAPHWAQNLGVLKDMTPCAKMVCSRILNDVLFCRFAHQARQNKDCDGNESQTNDLIE